jgi:hypothetical protein
MINRTKITLAAVLIAAFATPALAQDRWVIDSGRHVNGQVPSYQVPRASRAPRVIEGRNAAAFGSYGANGGAPSGRDAMVQSLGN